MASELVLLLILAVSGGLFFLVALAISSRGTRVNPIPSTARNLNESAGGNLNGSGNADAEHDHDHDHSGENRRYHRRVSRYQPPPAAAHLGVTAATEQRAAPTRSILRRNRSRNCTFLPTDRPILSVGWLASSPVC